MAYVTVAAANTHYAEDAAVRPRGWDALPDTGKARLLEQASRRLDLLPWPPHLSAMNDRRTDPGVLFVFYSLVGHYALLSVGLAEEADAGAVGRDVPDSVADLPAAVRAPLLTLLTAPGSIGRAVEIELAAADGTQAPASGGGLNPAEVDARIADWAEEGNPDPIPAEKLVDAPSGTGTTPADLSVTFGKLSGPVRDTVEGAAQVDAVDFSGDSISFASDGGDSKSIDLSQRLVPPIESADANRVLKVDSGGTRADWEEDVGGLSELQVDARVNALVPNTRRVPVVGSGDVGRILTAPSRAGGQPTWNSNPGQTSAQVDAKIRAAQLSGGGTAAPTRFRGEQRLLNAQPVTVALSDQATSVGTVARVPALGRNGSLRFTIGNVSGVQQAQETFSVADFRAKNASPGSGALSDANSVSFSGGGATFRMARQTGAQSYFLFASDTAGGYQVTIEYLFDEVARGDLAAGLAVPPIDSADAESCRNCVFSG